MSKESGHPNEISRMPLLACAVAVSWLAFVGSVLWRPHRGEYNPWMDVGLYNVPFGLSALASFTRSRRDVAQRAAWRALTLATLCFSGGNFYGSLVVGDRDIFPSPADALWLASYVFVYIAIVNFVRCRITRFYPSMWLDGAIAGFGAAAIVVAFAMAPVLEETEGRLSVVATTLAYPTADILLIIALIAAGMTMRTRALSWWILTCGMTATCAADVVYLFQESAGTYREGGLLDVGWPLGSTLIALAACTAGDKRTQAVGQRQLFAVPLVFATTSIALLVYGQGNQLHPVAIGLTIGAIASAVVRAALTVREVKALAASRQEARTDELTGLGNRRAFIERFETMLASGVPHAVMIIDLDRFKEVNDGLGHDVGDDLLCAVAVRLRELLGPDAAARLGGDEFGALVASHEPSAAVAVAQQSHQGAGRAIHAGRRAHTNRGQHRYRPQPRAG